MSVREHWKGRDERRRQKESHTLDVT
jgi:hypothetical protein